MSLPIQISKSYNIGGLSLAESRALSGDAVLQQDKTLAAAKVGVLTVRTNNTDGSLTMNAGHGFTTGQRLDIYWSGGCRRGITIGTVATNVVPITGGTGDNLPIATTALTAMVPTSLTFPLASGKTVALGAYGAAARTQFSFQSVAPAELLVLTLGPGVAAPSDLGHTYLWDNQDGRADPLVGVVTATVWVSHDDSSSARNIKLGALVNN